MENNFTTLPADPAILLSFVNMKLRDTYSSLEDMCSDLNFDLDKFIAHMAAKGWEYNPDAKKFW